MSKSSMTMFGAHGPPGVPVPAGLLYYSQLDSMLRVEARPNEIRALIMARNELAGWLAKQRRVPKEAKPDEISAPAPDMEEAFLPPTIDHAKECRSCYAVDTCMLYRKVSLATLRGLVWTVLTRHRQPMQLHGRRTTLSPSCSRRRPDTSASAMLPSTPNGTR